MFHPERLTGKRRRKYFASLNWVESIPIAEIPSTIRGRIKLPLYVKALVRVRIKDDKRTHHIAVIRNKIALLNHACEATQLTFGVLGQFDAWGECNCRDVRDMWATFTHGKASRSKIRDRRGRRMKWAEKVSDLPTAMSEIRMRCRVPKRDYRSIAGGKARRFTTIDTNMVPVQPTSKKAHFDAIGVRAHIESLFKGELRRQLAITHYEHIDVCHGRIQVIAHSTLGIRLCVYTWYSRVYTAGVETTGTCVPLAVVRFLGQTITLCLDIARLPLPGGAYDSSYGGNSHKYLVARCNRSPEFYELTENEFNAIRMLEENDRLKLE